jgi:phosphohistidine phosphatase SixA
MKCLLLGRHARTANPKSMLDLPLSDEGNTEANEMASKIRIVVRNLPLTIWSSTAQRAKETALIVKDVLEKRGIVIAIEFFDELWSDKTHTYQEEWLKENISSFEGDVLLIIAHAEISEFAVSLGCEYIPLSTGNCMMVRGDWAFKI